MSTKTTWPGTDPIEDIETRLTAIEADLAVIDATVNATDVTVGLIEDELEIIEDHIHSVAKVYPTMAVAITVTAGIGAWVLGAPVVIITGGVITEPFDIHEVFFNNISANDSYELVLYGGGVEIGRRPVARTAPLTASVIETITTPVQPANTEITAALASAAGGNNVSIKLGYHTY